ncbi:MAG: hypothetical protein EPN37_17605 [Chitinophagaceae bacterium]|nr:MAG: hypothetical protein EPN37_17605 [Chitinophagaceae bacterium]
MKQSNRRSFIKQAAISGLGITTAPGLLLRDERTHSSKLPHEKKESFNDEHTFNGAYSGSYLNRIAFPVGGIGAGMFCIEGSGAISHVSVRHRPQMFNEPGQFAALYIKGLRNGAKVLEGPVPDWKKYGLPGAGNGEGGTNYGLPRFSYAAFEARFPYCDINLHDKDIPLTVKITGWSPFIPTDPDNSSLPAGAIEYYFENKSHDTLEAVFSYNTRNFMKQNGGRNSIQKITNGLVLSQSAPEDKPWIAGDFALFTDQDNTVGDYCWFRGGWWDPLTVAWEAIKKGEVKEREPAKENAPGASLFVPFRLKPGEKKTIRIMMAWYVPDSDLRIGNDATAAELKAKVGCDPASGCCSSPNSLGIPVDDQYKYPKYKPWYSSKFRHIQEVADYWKNNYHDLYEKSMIFRDTFYASTLPAEVMEAVAANLSIIKSPTVLRQADGRLWAFEGCSDNDGCCYGSCTHVWNYAQAIPHLFPSLERSLRETEFCENQSADGHQMFRADLPIRPVHNDFYAAADGQLGGIMKVYREWHISGNNEWMKKLFPMVKKSLDYCIETWDPQHQGVLKEPHHNTYDIEFWGPDGMCTGFYLGALTAFIKMGEFLKQDISLYSELYSKGKYFIENELFNGEYFFQKIEYKDLKAANPVQEAEKSFVGKYSPEALELLKKEGPKYQYGTGCLSDGIIGAWMSAMCLLDDPVNREKTLSHLLSVYKYNFKNNLSEHANPQRPAYALGDEGGLLLCTWPKGGKLELPFVYSDEVWTGIEYEVASHLMWMGKAEEGLEIVRACRKRYNGRIRNPFDEYECGNWYARAMSSYAMLQGLTGVKYDSLNQTLYIDSHIGDFTTFLSTETGFGNVSLKSGKPFLKVTYGHIEVKKMIINGKEV